MPDVAPAASDASIGTSASPLRRTYFWIIVANPDMAMPVAAQIVGDLTQPDIYTTGEDGITSISRLCYQLAGQLVDADIATGNRLHTSVYKPFHTTPAAADFPLVR